MGRRSRDAERVTPVPALLDTERIGLTPGVRAGEPERVRPEAGAQLNADLSLTQTGDQLAGSPALTERRPGQD